MSKYKMVCLDIDGTLLNSKHEITENTKKVIREVVNEKQIPVVLVSARMPKGILFLQKELDIVQPIISYSGALIWDNNRILYDIAMPILNVKTIYRYAKKLGIHLSLYKENEWFIEKLDKWAKQEGEITKSIPEIIEFTLLFDKWELENSGPNKILCMAEPQLINSLQTLITEYHSEYLNVYPSKSTYLEISSINATKTYAIELLAKNYGIKSSEIIAIGDNYNDINMIEYAGLGIAMGNAPDDVKLFAKDVTFSNDEDGVAEALKKHIFV